MIKLTNKNKSKKAWLRIFEAFLAVLLVFGVLLVIISRSNSSVSKSAEIMKLERGILVSISQDATLRDQILVNNTLGSKNYIEKIKPTGLNYSLQICNPLEVCPLTASEDVLVNNEIYASNILIISNLSDYNERQLKLFFWEI